MSKDSIPTKWIEAQTSSDTGTDDPEEYIGFKTKGATPADAAAEAAAEGEETPEV
jgi:hypothetical protein